MLEERTYYDSMIKEYDVPVTMRDGVTLRVDVYRPDAPGRFPVLYTCAMHNKDLQRVEVAENLKVGQPAWSTQWYGVIEAATPRGSSRTGTCTSSARCGAATSPRVFVWATRDHYDTFEWIMPQPWWTATWA